MFDKLFKSRQQRELEREVKVQRALGMHRQQVNKLRKHEREYMEKAIRAKSTGDKGNLKRLCAFVAQTTNQRRAIESQLLFFETMLQTRDKVRLFKEFGQGMNAMARSIRDVFHGLDADGILKDVTVALEQSSKLETTMGLVLDRIGDSMPTPSEAEGSVSGGDVERIVMQDAVQQDANADDEIEAGLKAIEKALMEEA